jgi:serine/threonine protein kinase
MNETPPPRLGRYEILRVLGKGAMAVVYEARDPQLERNIAIKTLRQDSLDDPEVVKRFVREARAVATLSHPNIASVYDVGVEGDIAYLVMELVRGDSLQRYVHSNEPLPAPAAVRIIGELLDALSYAHARGIVHRDVKPANVLLDDAGHVKLADFGVARVEGPSNKTMVGLVLGTPRFMAPEQLTGGAVGPQTDLFAVGVILYRLLTGRDPFEGATMTELMYRIVTLDPPAPSSYRDAGVPKAFDVVLRRALAKDVARRYPSAEAFARDLRQALGADGELPEKVSASAGSAGLLSTLDRWLTKLRSNEPSSESTPASDQTSTRVPAHSAFDSAMDSTTPGGVAPPVASNFERPDDATVLAPREALPSLDRPPALSPARSDGTMLFHVDDLTLPGQRPAVQLVITTSADPRAVGHAFPLDAEECVLGREPGANLYVDDSRCSRRHAVIRYTGAGFAIQDLGSSNGTFLNGRRLGGEPQRLGFGASIRIGETTLAFVNARDTTLPDLTGTVLSGRYRLERCLRTSPKGAVYQATISGFGGAVAVKLLSADLASYPGYGERFKRQAALATRLQHPHICPVLDHGLADLVINGRAVQTPFLCFTMMAGGSLEARMAEKAVPDLADVRRWITQLAAALEHAHRNDIVHGDLKPTSVCFDADGNAYLMDFAIAGPDSPDAPLVGAPAFMAPEQWRGEASTVLTDQFALGVLAYSLVTGSRPFIGQDDPVSRERNFRRKPFPAHEEARQNGRENVPRQVSEVLQRALSTRPEERFESVDAFARAFAGACSRRGGRSTNPTVFVSYQHEPSAGWAVLLARELKDKHRIAAFVDTQRLDGAMQFPEKLSRAIENCQVFVCLLAESTLASRWVREEIRLAHEFKRPMIPVFQESFTQVERDSLDPAVASLLHHDGVHLLDRRNIHIDHTIDDLARLVLATVRDDAPDDER